MKPSSTKYSASIVLFNNNIEQLKRLLNILLSSEISIKVFLIDNSKTNRLQQIENTNSNIIYIFNNKNLGYGKGHNIAVKKAYLLGYKYHFIINPDIYLESRVLNELVNFIESDNLIGMVMPQILNKDKTIQYLPKLLPTPFSVLMRKIKWPAKIYSKFINRYELRLVDPKLIYNSPILSGCFSLVNIKIFEEVGGYDDRFFMYFEDWDLSRRVNMKYKTIYYPSFSVIHEYESGANKNLRLAKIFAISAFKYFNKWGWFFDKNRSLTNKTLIKEISESPK